LGFRGNEAFYVFGAESHGMQPEADALKLPAGGENQDKPRRDGEAVGNLCGAQEPVARFGWFRW